MRLNGVDLLRVLPQFMQNDRNFRAFAYALNKELNSLYANTIHARIYSRIDNLSEAVLDELAWQFNVVEYHHEYDVSIKRKLIKNCMITHRRRGTVAAVEDVVKNVYGDATVEEWFGYGGKPYHFKITTSNVESTDEMIAEITQIVKDTQNVRSRLEAVVIEIIQRMGLYVGCKAIIMDDITLKTKGL